MIRTRILTLLNVYPRAYEEFEDEAHVARDEAVKALRNLLATRERTTKSQVSRHGHERTGMTDAWWLKP
jgi:hypothetical protein